MRVRGRLEHLLKIVDGETEIEVVHVAGEEMELADELRADRRPIPLRILAQIKAVVAHINRDVMVDLPSELVPERAWIAVVADRAVHRFPRLELIGGATVTAEHRLEAAQLTRRPKHLALGGAPKRTLGGHELPERNCERIRVGIDVRLLIVPEVDGIGLEHPGTAEEVGML